MGTKMKRNKLVIVLSIASLFLSSSVFYPQNQLGEDQVKDALTKIFEMSKNNNFVQISKKLLNDESKEIRSYDPNDKQDLKAVKRIAKKIKAYLNLSDSYEYESISYNSFKNLQSAEIKVNFKSGDQELKISFIFIEKSGSILLADFK